MPKHGRVICESSGYALPGAGNQILEDVAIYSEHRSETLRQQVQYDFLVQFLYTRIRNLVVAHTDFGVIVHKASSTLHSIQVFSIYPDPVLLDGFFDAFINISAVVGIYQ